MKLPPTARQVAEAAAATSVGVASVKRIEILGRLEETVLLATMVCGTAATVDDIRRKVEENVGERSFTNMVTTLDRMADKGLLEVSSEASPTKRKGGRKRKLYRVTQVGVENVTRSWEITSTLAAAAGLNRVA